MANELKQEAPAGLSTLIAGASQADTRGLPPVHLWNPPDCGDIGLRIDRGGRWSYRGSLITRPALVKLFSTILRKDPGGYVLVTPVEKVTVEVEDVPFVAVEMRVEGSGEHQKLHFRTNVDEWICAGPHHSLRFEQGPSKGLKPYLRVREDLWALVCRPVFYDLAALAEMRAVEGGSKYGVFSMSEFFIMSTAEDDEDNA